MVSWTVGGASVVTGTAGGFDSGVGTTRVGAVGCTTGEEVGFSEGFSEGFSDGFSEGFSEGFSVGFSGAGVVLVTLTMVE